MLPLVPKEAILKEAISKEAISKEAIPKEAIPKEAIPRKQFSTPPLLSVPSPLKKNGIRLGHFLVTLGSYFVVMQGSILLNGEVPMNMPPLHKDDSRFSPLNNQIDSMNTNKKRVK